MSTDPLFQAVRAGLVAWAADHHAKTTERRVAKARAALAEASRMRIANNGGRIVRRNPTPEAGSHLRRPATHSPEETN